ncbi:hypothetical protein TELCIR_05949, partial [Teladorsagia circumcincta]
WEVMDTWRRHCYWGPSGCKEELPEGQPEWYWSLLEFGVKLKRHAPYFGLTIVMPTIITCLLTLSSFWIDTPSMAIALVIFNVLLQGLFGWDLIRELPPGSGSIPKIGDLLNYTPEEEDPKEFNSPFSSIGPPNALDEEHAPEEERRNTDGETLIPVESGSPSTVISLSPVPPNVEPSSAEPAENKPEITKTSQSLYIIMLPKRESVREAGVETKELIEF